MIGSHAVTRAPRETFPGRGQRGQDAAGVKNKTLQAPSVFNVYLFMYSAIKRHTTGFNGLTYINEHKVLRAARDSRRSVAGCGNEKSLKLVPAADRSNQTYIRAQCVIILIIIKSTFSGARRGMTAGK